MTLSNTVLVISDKPEQFNLAASRLREDGYRVRFEKNTLKSLNIARAESPRLIISELAVPDIDGLELCLNIRQNKNLGSTPILLVGDLSKESSIVADGLRCGATDYLQKPFSNTSLFNICRNLAGDGGQFTQNRTETLFDAVVENLSDAVSILDAEGTIIFASPSTNQVLRNDPADLVGRRMIDLVHPEDARAVEQYLDSLFWESKVTEPIVHRFRENNVSWTLVESIGRITDDSRFGSVVVITSREVNESNALLDTAVANGILRKSIFNSSPVALAIFSPSGHFIEGNPALFVKLSNTKSELHNMSLSELIFPAHDHADRHAIADILSGKRLSYDFDNGYLKPNGERVWGRLSLVMCSGRDSESNVLVGIFNEPDEQLDPWTKVKSPARVLPMKTNPATVLNFGQWKVNKSLLSEN